MERNCYAQAICHLDMSHAGMRVRYVLHLCFTRVSGGDETVPLENAETERRVQPVRMLYEQPRRQSSKRQMRV